MLWHNAWCSHTHPSPTLALFARAHPLCCGCGASTLGPSWPAIPVPAAVAPPVPVLPVPIATALPAVAAAALEGGNSGGTGGGGGRRGSCAQDVGALLFPCYQRGLTVRSWRVSIDTALPPASSAVTPCETENQVALSGIVDRCHMIVGRAGGPGANVAAAWANGGQEKAERTEYMLFSAQWHSQPRHRQSKARPTHPRIPPLFPRCSRSTCVA
jgi:hypothetical protein